MPNSTILRPEMVTDILNKIQAVTDENDQNIKAMSELVENDLFASFTGQAGAKYRQSFEEAKEGAFKAFAELMRIYQEALAVGADELAMSDEEIAGQMNVNVGTTIGL